MTLTHQNLHDLGNKGGNGFNRGQLHALGIAWPPKDGWLRRLIGTEISKERYALALEMKGMKPAQQKATLGDEYPNPAEKTRQAPPASGDTKIFAEIERLAASLRAGERYSALDHAENIVRILR